MPSSFKAAYREACATARTDVVYLDTLEIANPGIESLYLIRDRNSSGRMLRLETGDWKQFSSVAFRVKPPSSGDTGLQELSIAIDNVGNGISTFLKNVLGSNKPVEVTYRPYLSTDNTQPQMDPPLTLYLTDVVVNGVEVTGRATFADLLNRKFLSELYTRRRFPTLGT